MNHNANIGGSAIHDDVRLSLCMIVKDAARTLSDCLSSIRPWVDEMVVVDTGSSDATVDIARKHGARLFHFAWQNDFALARNVSLEQARGQWIFWMDADDTIDEVNGQKLRLLARRDHGSDVLGYVLQVHCPEPSGRQAGGTTVVDHIKVVRNRPDLRFEGRIHEQISPSIRRAGGGVEWTDIFVTHSGHDYSPAGQGRKNQRDLALPDLDLRDRPNHPFVLFNLGMTHANMGNHQAAVQSFERCLELAQPDESPVPKAYALLAASYASLEDYTSAWNAMARGRRLFPGDPELLFRYGILAHHFGRLREAEHAYLAILRGKFAPRFASIDQGIFGAKARQNLASVYDELGEWTKAEEQWKQVCNELPENRAAWKGLGEALLRQGKLGEVERLSIQMLERDALRTCGHVLRAKWAQAWGNVAAAKVELQAAVAEDPAADEALHELGKFLFQHGPRTTEKPVG